MIPAMTRSGNVLSEILLSAAAAMKERGIPSARLDAEVLLSHHLGIGRPRLYTAFRDTLTDEQAEGFRGLVRRRLEGEPVAYIVGCKEFWALPIKVSPAVLIPRPDTEVLVEEVLRVAGGLGGGRLDIVEIGTGSGAVSIALAKELPDAGITATDISRAALELARENAAANAVGDRIAFVHGNLFQPLSEKFDIIAANPPYIPEEAFSHLPDGVRKFEPARALVAGPEGTEFHERLMGEGWAYLRDGGWLVMEMGDGQKERIEELFRRDGRYGELGFSTDYAGLWRVARARRKV